MTRYNLATSLFILDDSVRAEQLHPFELNAFDSCVSASVFQFRFHYFPDDQFARLTLEFCGLNSHCVNH